MMCVLRVGSHLVYLLTKDVTRVDDDRYDCTVLMEDFSGFRAGKINMCCIDSCI